MPGCCLAQFLREQIESGKGKFAVIRKDGDRLLRIVDSANMRATAALFDWRSE
jgi:hypothetical protein